MTGYILCKTHICAVASIYNQCHLTDTIDLLWNQSGAIEVPIILPGNIVLM